MRTHRPFAAMNTTPRAALASALAVVLGTAVIQAHAADSKPPIKPGLWEITTESRTLNGQPMPDMSSMMAERLKQMLPETRAKMEAQMKAHGMQMTPQAGGLAVRMCLTQELLDRNMWQRQEGRCQNTAMSQSGATWNWKFTCTEPRSEGEGSTTFNGGDAYTARMKVTTQLKGQSQPQVVTMVHRAKRLGSDCGDIKPFTPPPSPPSAKP
jgi:hypothetical protein